MMKKLPLHSAWFQGAVSVEITEEGAKPWRIPYDQAALFVPGHIGGRAELSAGVRIALSSDTTAVRVSVKPAAAAMQMDCHINGTLKEIKSIASGETSFEFAALPAGNKKIELYLSQKQPVRITGLEIDTEALASPVVDGRPRWVTYGSSITQCNEAASPSQTWPALAAQAMDVNLTCLGYGGNCHMEPMVARMIRDLPADFISMCVGINIMGGSTLSARTFQAALVGFIQIVREKHPTTELAVISPIYSKNREETDNKVGLTLVKMREQIEEAVSLLRQHGDRHIHYINGLELFGESYFGYLPDGLHPNAEGYRLMAENFVKLQPFVKM